MSITASHPSEKMSALRRTRVTVPVALAAGLMIGFVSFGGAASTAAAESHARTVTGYYSLAASPLTPDGLGMTNEDYFDQWDPSTLSNQDNGRCFNAGLSVPAGATMKSATFFYNPGTTTMYFEVNRQDLFNHTAVVLVHGSTSTVTTPAPTTYTSTTKVFPTATAKVGYDGYAYSVGVCPNGSATFSGLTIRYTMPAG